MWLVALHPGHHRLEAAEQVRYGLGQLNLHEAWDLPDVVRLLRHLLGQFDDADLHLHELLFYHGVLELGVHPLLEVVVLRLEPELLEVVVVRLEPELLEVGLVVEVLVLVELGVPGVRPLLERWVGEEDVESSVIESRGFSVETSGCALLLAPVPGSVPVEGVDLAGGDFVHLGPHPDRHVAVLGQVGSLPGGCHDDGRLV